MSEGPAPSPPRSPARWPIWAAMAVCLSIAAILFAYWRRASPEAPKIERQIAGRVSDGRPVRWQYFVNLWCPRMALANAVGLTVLAASWPWILRRRIGPNDLPSPGESPGAPGKPDRLPKAAPWLAIGIVALAAAAQNWPRMHQSLWGDEESTMRRFVVGEYHRDDATGALTFHQPTWPDTFFFFKDPNNHVLFSIVSRLSHQWLARAPQGPLEPYFSEWAMRLPALLAALAGLFVIFRLGRDWFGLRAAAMATAIMVLHPWFVRYSTEARGYAFLLALVPLAWMAIDRAVATGRWRWWWLLAVSEFAMLGTWPLAVHTCLAINLAAALLIWTDNRRKKTERLTLSLRWLVTGAVAAMAYLQAFLPHLLQLKIYLARERARGAVDLAWLGDAAAWLLTGRGWQDADASNPRLTVWARVWKDHPFDVCLTGAVLAIALCFGIASMAGDRRRRCFLIALLLPPTLVVANSLASGNILLPWYLLPSLPALALFLAAGIDELINGRKPASPIAWTAALGAVALYGRVGAPQRTALRAGSLEPNREAALAVQTAINPGDPAYLSQCDSAGFMMQIMGYDPGSREFKDLATLRRYVDEATAAGKDLAITFGQYGLSREHFPEIMATLEDPAQFEKVAVYWGLDPHCTRYVFRHRHRRDR